MDAWFHFQMDLQAIEFHEDQDGNWKGTWTTPDDMISQDIVDEEMEYNIQFENMELVTRERRILTAEDASMKTFDMSVEGRSAQSSNVSVDSQDQSTTAASVAAGDGGRGS